jgi:alkylation response protein AidB-like acyl-CoA dehydrogenase
MSEQGELLSQTAQRVFADLEGADAATAKRAIDDAGLALVLVPEDSGGFGGTWEDANRIFFAAGAAALDYPIAEAIIAAAPQAGWDNDKQFRVMALARAGQMAGAISAALTLSVEYTRQRQQFGKPLATFQAIQQQLAVLAEEAAACRAAAAAAAAHALDRGDASFEIACAKLRANIAAGQAASIAHQVHGAIGFTKEYALQKFTRRLWAWRSEYGNDRYWADRIGAIAAARGADGFWPGLVSGFRAA